MSPAQMEHLVAKALEARRLAYAPCSGFAVGAAVLAASGRIYTGCNVENASSGATVCAERVAILKAISEGERELVALAVAAETEGVCPPCGICRQTMIEFGPQMLVIMADLAGRREVRTAEQLLPLPFTRTRMRAEGSHAD
ncbi:MAG: cytidine deaminase [Bacillota bacterium]|nr:cytidine deaminase [Bacillota bacterium]